MFRRELWRAGVGFKQEDRDGGDDQGGGEQDDTAAHYDTRLIDIVVE